LGGETRIQRQAVTVAIEERAPANAEPASGRLIAAAAFVLPPFALLVAALGLALRGGGVAQEQWQPVAVGLIASLLVLAAVGAIRSALILESAEIAAATACGIAFFAAAAYDWVWQLAGIAIVGVGMLGLALGAIPSLRTTGSGRRRVLRPVLALVAVAAIIPQYVVLASGSHLRNSQDAFAVGNGAKARSEALSAKAIEPWAASPYLQLAIVSESQGDLPTASRQIDEAIQRSKRDWSLWVRAAIIETQRGNIHAARRDLAEVRRLDPHSAILANDSG